MKRQKPRKNKSGKLELRRTILRASTTAFFIFIYLFISAQPITQERALNVAQIFYNSNLIQDNNLKSAKPKSLDIALTNFINSSEELKSSQKLPAYYIINIDDNEGFIIVAGDERSQPILAYSLEGAFNQDYLPEQMHTFLNSYNSEITDIVKNGDNRNMTPNRKWDELETGYTKSGNLSEPFFLVNSNWSQGKFYNDFCPSDEAMVSAAYNGHVPAGCVAVVMSQIMHYWSWPAKGVGENCYIPSSNNKYGEQCANFENAYYNFSAMPASLSASNEEVAELIYHAAVSVKMNFSPTGSSAFSSSTAKALKNNFNFSEKAEFVFKSDYTDTEWVELLKTHLNNQVPLYYRGDKDGSSAHAFVCDGYDQDGRFHFNWGWSGRYNGYFSLTAMDPYANYNYSSNQGAIINLFPANNDFTIGEITSNATVEKGESLELSFEHIYNGSDFYDLEVSSECWISSDNIIDENDFFIGDNQTILSSENNIAVITYELNIPETIESGNYFILISSDTENYFNEIDEDNNIKSFEITITEPEESSEKSTIACSDGLEPNNSDIDAYYLGVETNYYNNSLCLTNDDEDWFEFSMNSETYFVKIATSGESKNGFYGLEFIFNGGIVEILTIETEGKTDTKIWLYDSEFNLLAEDDNGGEDLFASLTYNTSVSTGTSFFSNNNFNLYPNPVKEKVYINTDIQIGDNVTIVLMDIRGTLLEKKILNNIHQSNYSLDLSHYSDGQYIVGIYSDNGDFVTKKIMKNSMI